MYTLHSFCPEYYHISLSIQKAIREIKGVVEECSSSLHVEQDNEPQVTPLCVCVSITKVSAKWLNVSVGSTLL